jgi:hypothetical protein
MGNEGLMRSKMIDENERKSNGKKIWFKQIRNDIKIQINGFFILALDFYCML